MTGPRESATGDRPSQCDTAPRGNFTFSEQKTKKKFTIKGRRRRKSKKLRSTEGGISLWNVAFSTAAAKLQPAEEWRSPREEG